MMKRTNAFRLLYLGAWIAGMELGFELLLPLALGPLPSPLVYVMRAFQVGGIVAAIVGAVSLARPVAPQAPASMSDVDALLHADAILSAYLRDVLEHLFFAGLVLMLLLVYGWTLYLRVLRYEEAHGWYYAVLLATLACLIGAWLTTTLRILREERRYQRSPTSEAPTP